MELLGKVTADFGDLSLPSKRDWNKRRMYGGTSRRTYQPVRKSSFLKGREGTFWRSMSRRDARQIVLAARRYEVATKEKGKRNGALGSVAIEILDYFANLMDYRTGRLDPSIATLMRKLCRCRDAIVRALKALRQHGFLDWLRRYVPTGNEGRGVQVQQTSNAYRLFMPKRAKELLGRYGKAAPIPDDAATYEANKAALIDEWLNEMPMSEQITFKLEDDALSRSLVRFAKAIEEKKKRESVQQTESLSRSIINREKDMP